MMFKRFVAHLDDALARSALTIWYELSPSLQRLDSVIVIPSRVGSRRFRTSGGSCNYDLIDC